MNRRNLITLIDDAIQLDREIAERTEQLKAIKADLVAIADQEPEDDRTETPGGGWSLTFEGNAGIARVTKPGLKLKSSINPESKVGEKILDKVGDHKDSLFYPEMKLVPVENFRDRLADLFKPGQAAALLKAMTTDSATTVSFETKEKA